MCSFKNRTYKPCFQLYSPVIQNIIVSGIKLIGFHRIDRRTHYIVAASLALGVGTALVPAFSSPGIGASAEKPNQWWPYNPDMSDALNSFRVGVMIAVNTPYFIGSFVAILLNLLVPVDSEDPEEIAIEEEWLDEESEALTDEKDADPEDPDPTQTSSKIPDSEE